MILDEKVIMYPPPPPYRVASSRSRSSISSSSTRTHVPHNPQANLSALPAHILLQIIHHCFPSEAHMPLLPPPPSLQSSSPSGPSSPHGPSSSSSNASQASSAAAQAQAQAQARQYLEHLRLSQPSTPEKQRKTLYWLATSLRLVSRSLYTACMHVLRSTYLPAYLGMIRAGYSSDPFPMGVPVSMPVGGGGGMERAGGRAGSVSSSIGPPAYESYPPSPSPSPSLPSFPLSTSQYPHQQPPILTPHRETPILDLFIALKVRQDVLADESELHLDREDSFRDLFEVAQPRARLEDLVMEVGGREGVVWVGGQVGSSGSTSRWSSSLVSLTPPQRPVKAAVEEEDAAPVPSSSTQTQTRAQAPSHPPTPKTRRSLFSSLPFMSTSNPSSKKPSPSSSSPSSERPSPAPRPQPLPFSSLSISFSPRRVGLVLNKTKTIAEVQRMSMGSGRQKEPLESLAERLVGEVKRNYGY